MSVTANPRTIAQLLAAAVQPGAFPYRQLIVGQIGSDGTATSGQHYENVESLTNTQVYDLFGSNSELSGRIMRARKVIAGRCPISVIALTAAAGTAATLDITVTGTATEDGTLTLKVIDAEEYTINVDVLEGDVANDIATNIKAAIDALTTLPATAGAVSVGAFTLTASDVGTIPNKYTVKAVTEVAGVTVAAGQFTSGATDPAVTTIFDNVSEVRFHAISWPWQATYADVDAFLVPRNIFNNNVLQGVAFIGIDDTEANLSALVNGGTPLNSANLIFGGNRQVSGESVIVTPPDWRWVEFISIVQLRMTEGIPISQYVTTAAPRDVIGGTGSASLAFYNTPLQYTDIGDPNLLFTGTEQSNLEADGFTIIGTNPAKTSAIMGQVVTTYKTDRFGNADPSFKYYNYVLTGYYALELFFRTLQTNNSQARLTQGNVVAGRNIQNQKSIEAQNIDIYTLLSGEDYVLVPAGFDATEYFYDNLNVALDFANGIVTISGKLPIVTQIRQINITYQLSFEIGG